MPELLQILYNYARNHRMLLTLEQETQYMDSSVVSEKEYRKLQQLLSEESRAHLENYNGERVLQHSIELESIFRAGLSIGLELSRL